MCNWLMRALTGSSGQRLMIAILPTSSQFKVRSHKKLAQQLHAKISAGEKAAIQQPPPDDVVAYDHPRNFFTLQQIAISYGVLRRYGEEKSVLDRALAIEPSDVDTKWRLRPWNFTRKLTPERCIERSIPFEPQIPRSCRTSLMIG
jgi:hypothetical protein